MRNLFILVPSFIPTGPVKGAVALANALADVRKITLVTLKGGDGPGASLDHRVLVVSLADVGRWHRRVAAYRSLLADAGGRACIASISFCFSADMVNLLCRNQAVTCSSIRGNLVHNYRMDYGPPGIPLAMAHLAALRWFDHVVAMTEAMATQANFYCGRRPKIIGNFIDEQAIECYRKGNQSQGPLRFVFLASLSHRKQPFLLLQAMSELRCSGVEACLDIIGDGPLRTKLAADVARLNLCEVVTLHGHLSNPYELLAKADTMVLPSLSEGLPRASLEALHLGVPCVLRATDGNAELIFEGMSGTLFERDADLPDAMIKTALWSRRRAEAGVSLLPSSFRQREASLRYLALVETGK